MLWVCQENSDELKQQEYLLVMITLSMLIMRKDHVSIITRVSVVGEVGLLLPAGGDCADRV